MNTTVENTTVKYKYIPKRVHGITNKNHVLYDGKLDGSIDKFSVLRNESGQFVIVLSKEDKESIIKKMGLEDDELNFNKRSNPFLEKLSVEMPKQGLILDLENPLDMLKDGVLRAYSNIFAPSLSAVNHKASYRYVRVFSEDEVSLSLKKSDIRKTFYKLLGNLEDSREKMVMYLLNEGKRVHPSIVNDRLKHEVNIQAEKSMAKFISTVNDDLFIEKGMINMGVAVGTIAKRSSLYYYEGQPLSLDGEPATMNNACIFLKTKKNSEIRAALSKKVLNDFKRTK